MTTTVEAIYENGLLRPLAALPLKEHQRVTVTVTERQFDKEAMLAWMAEAAALRERIRQESGVLPDSTPLIAEDRLRDI